MDLTHMNFTKNRLYRYLLAAALLLISSCARDIKLSEQKSSPPKKEKEVTKPKKEQVKREIIKSSDMKDIEAEHLEEVIEEVPEISTAPLELDNIKKPDDDELFYKAEDYFNSSHLTRALSLFNRFLSLNRKKLADAALFRTGQIYFYIKDFSSSLKNFTKIRNEFPFSEYYRETEYYIGLNNFFLGNFNDAISVFENIAPNRLDNTRLSEIYYFMGKSRAYSGGVTDAISDLLKAMELSSNLKLKEYAAEFIKDTIINKVNKDDLLRIISAYENRFPSDYALYRLIYYYSKEKRHEDAKEALIKLISDYKQFEYRKEAENWLTGLGAVNHSKEIKIGCLLPLSGKRKEAGLRVLRGIRLAFNSFVKDIADYDIRLIIRDSQGDPQTAETLARELALTDNVSIVIGPVFSKTVLRIAPIADKYRIPFFTPTASADGLVENSPYLFRNCMTQRSQGMAVAEYAFNSLQLKRFAILYPNNRYGAKLKNVFRHTIERMGGEIVTERPYPYKKTYDFTKEIKSIGGVSDDDIRRMVTQLYSKRDKGLTLWKKDAIALSEPIIDKGIDLLTNKDYIKTDLLIKYDALYLPGYVKTVGLIAPELTFFNLSGIKLLGSNGWNSPDLSRIGGKYVEGSFFVDGFFVNSSLDRVKRFVREYKNAFHDEPDILSAQSFDAVKIIGTAMKLGLITREGIREYLSHDVKEFKGVSGVTTLLPSGESEKALFYLTVRRGKIVEIDGQ